MNTIIELAIITLSAALIVQVGGILLFHVWIGREQEEIRKISQRIDSAEESIKKMNGSLVTIRSHSGAS
jgi:hypothetical protein